MSEGFLRLRAQGFQPRSTAGSAQLEKHLQQDRLTHNRTREEEQQLVSGQKPDPLRSRLLGLQVQPLTGEEYGDDIAGFVWQDAPWLISGTVATLDGNLIVRDLQIRPSPTVFDEHGIPSPRRHPPDSGITMSVLRRLNLDQILHDVTETLATAGPRYEVWKRFMRERGIDPRGLVLADSRADEAAQRIATAKLRRGRKGYGDEHYREIAVLYLDVFAQGVRKGIHREIARRYAEARAEPADFHPVGTIRYWIAQAHKRGFLTEAHPGKAGAMPGPRLREERVGRKGKQQ